MAAFAAEVFESRSGTLARRTAIVSSLVGTCGNLSLECLSLLFYNWDSDGRWIFKIHSCMDRPAPSSHCKNQTLIFCAGTRLSLRNKCVAQTAAMLSLAFM